MKNTIENTNAEDTFREYDGLVGLALLNIHTISKEKGVVRLYDFDRKNREHLFLLRMALTIRDIYHFPIEVEGTYWDIFCINQKIKRGFDKISRYKPVKGIGEEWLYAKGGVCVPELLDLMRPDGIERLGEDFSFEKIYNLYYEGSCN